MGPKTNGDKQFNFLLGEEEVGNLPEEEGEATKSDKPAPGTAPTPEGEYHEPPILHPPPVDVLGTDPREDMNERYQDGALWVCLMQYAKDEHTQFLAGLFHYLRSMGAALIPNEEGRRVIRPVAWGLPHLPAGKVIVPPAMRQDYAEFKETQMATRQKEIMDCLGQLEG